MSQPDGLREVVALFGDDPVPAIVTALRFDEFEALVARTRALDTAYAGRRVRAAYGAVDDALTLVRAVLFVLPVDEDGLVEARFNVKVRYLGEQAGPGPDLGNGVIRVACQTQCPVPWDVGKLWEPETDGEAHPLLVFQRMIWRNHLGLAGSRPAARRVPDGATSTGAPHAGSDRAAGAATKPQPVAGVPVVGLPVAGSAGMDVEPVEIDEANFVRVYNERLEAAQRRFREELELQQHVYLEQINACREEVRRLKVTLRQERDRSRKLQDLVRGDRL